MKNYWIGMDIGGTKCAVQLATLHHGIQLLDNSRFETQCKEGFESVFERLCLEMETLLARNSLDIKQVRAIGISCGGPLDSQRGIIMGPPNLPGWDNIPLVQLLQDRYGIPAFLQNDANACALVEWKIGAGRGTQNMIFLTFGTGLGAGIIASGRLVQGFRDMGGEVGHLRLTEKGPLGFGKEGSFEGYVSGGGIRRQALKLTEDRMNAGTIPAWIRDGHTMDEIDARLIAEYARHGDADALAIFNVVGDMLGRGIALLVDTLNPERIVIGSIFGRCEPLLRESMYRSLREEAIPYALEGLSIVPAQTGESLGDYAGVMAALYALGIDPEDTHTEPSPASMSHFERLFSRYPSLSLCRNSLLEAFCLLRNSFRQGGKLLVFGNGGSSADSEHIVGELMKGFYFKRPLDAEKKERIRMLTSSLLPETADVLQQGLPAIALDGHCALSTAAQNDIHPLLAPAEQIVGYGRPGDVFIGISTSGNSRNVALAAAVAKGLGLVTIGLTGASGGTLSNYCDCTITVPASTPADVQELHLPVYHTLCAMLESELFEE